MACERCDGGHRDGCPALDPSAEAWKRHICRGCCAWCGRAEAPRDVPVDSLEAEPVGREFRYRCRSCPHLWAAMDGRAMADHQVEVHGMSRAVASAARQAARQRWEWPPDGLPDSFTSVRHVDQALRA